MFYVGTSGWQYRSWRDAFYEGRPQRAWLSHYVTVFPTVEVNNSFYRLPAEATFDTWREETPGGFVFVVKASRYITHIRRLRDAGDSVRLFWSRATRLGDKLGPVLFQTPPNLRCDVDVLAAFLRTLPGEMRAAFEFREASWWDPRVYSLLDEAGAAWVLADRPGARVPLIVTGGWSYVRFHQGREFNPKYATSKLRAWAERLAGLDVADVWTFFNNDPLAAAPFDAVAFMDLLRGLGQEVAGPAG